MSTGLISDADIFRRETEGVGRVYRAELMPEAVRRNYDRVAAVCNDLIRCAREAVPRLPSIHFDFVIDGTINAYAFKSEGRFFIALNTGTLYMLRLIIGRMLADPTLFEWVGDPAQETANLPQIEGYDPAMPDADQIYLVNEIATPRDAVRRAFAQYLQDHALMFFIGHEIAHISRGHVGYICDVRGSDKYSENLILGTVADELRLERQSMEQDADGRSVGSRIASLRDTLRDPAFRQLPWTIDENAAATLIRDWSISLSIVFQMFGDPLLTGSGLERSLHPPPVLRWHWAQGVARWAIDTYWDKSLGASALDGLLQGRKEVRKAFATIFKTITIDPVPPKYMEDGIQHLFNLNRYWNTRLVETLRPYAFEF